MNTKSFSNFTYLDLEKLGVRVERKGFIDKPNPIAVGTTWNFVKYSNREAYIDTQLYYTDKLPTLLGYFQRIIDQYL